MNPQVVHLIMCDAVYPDPRNLLRLIVRGIQVRLRARNPPPVLHNCHALAMMVGFTGTGDLWVQVVDQATGRVIFQGPHRRVRFPQDPEEVYGVRFQINRCPLPNYGSYRLELVLEGAVIAARPFWLAPRT